MAATPPRTSPGRTSAAADGSAEAGWIAEVSKEAGEMQPSELMLAAAFVAAIGMTLSAGFVGVACLAAAAEVLAMRPVGR